MRTFVMTLVSVLCLSTAATASDTAKIAVLSEFGSGTVGASSLILKVGGKGYRVHHNGWRQTSRGYETTVTFPRSLLRGQSKARLTREDGRGWSDWGRSEMQYLQSNDVHSGDPACLGGTAWCATRGL